MAIDAGDAPVRTGSSYPAPCAAQMGERLKRKLGDVFGLTAFGGLVALLLVTYAFRSVGTRH